MKYTSYFILVLCSCVFWGVIFAITFYNTASENWVHDACRILLMLDAVVATESTVLLIIAVVRKRKGHDDKIDG